MSLSKRERHFFTQGDAKDELTERNDGPDLRLALLVALGRSSGDLVRHRRLGLEGRRRSLLLPLRRRARVANLHDQLPLGRGGVPLKVPHHLRHEPVVLDPVVTAVQDDHDPSDGGTGHGHAQGGLDPELDGTPAALEEVSGGVGHELLPGGDAGLVDTAGEAAAGEEGELLGVVPEEAQVVDLVAGQGHHLLGGVAVGVSVSTSLRRRRGGRRQQHVVVVGHLDVHHGAPREAQPSHARRRGRLAPAPPARRGGIRRGSSPSSAFVVPSVSSRGRTPLGRDPDVDALERHPVVLDVGRDLGQKGRG